MLNSLKRTFGYTAYTWGNAKLLGREETKTKGAHVVQPIESLRGRIAKIAFSAKHAAAITTDGKLFTWGHKKYGKLGLPGAHSDVVQLPTEVTFFSKNGIKLKDVVVAKNHTLVLDSEGRVFSFGKGSFSNSFIANMLFSEFVALGHSKAEHVTKPKQIERLANTSVSQIATGNHFAIALTKDGQLMVWGRGEFGVLGCGNKQVAEPIVNEVVKKICEGTGTSIVKVKSCADFSSILMSDGLLYSFGNNDEGVMGIGRNIGVDLCEVVNVPTPIEFQGSAEKVKDFDLGETSSVVLTESGKVYQMGQRLFFNPEPFKIDYSTTKVKSVTAFSKGIGVVTEDNRILTKGTFWPVEREVDEDVNTGVGSVNFGNLFDGGRIVEIGNRYGECAYVLVEEQSKGH